MKSKIHYKISPGKSISLLALLLFTNSLLFAQVDKEAEKGSKHIKIEAEVDGKMINVDTIIPAGADFDHAAFLNSLGLEGHEGMDSENGFTYEYDTEDGKTDKEKTRCEVEVEENEDGTTVIKKRVYIADGDGAGGHKVIKKKMDSDGDEQIIIIKDGEVIEGDAEMMKKKMGGQNVIIIEQDSDEDGKEMKTKVWVDEDGTKHKLKEGDKKVIIIKEESEDGKTITKKVWVDEDGEKHVTEEGNTVIIIKEEAEKKEKKKRKKKKN